MEKNRTHYSTEESGIALVTALIVVLASLLLVSGLTYVLRGSWKVATINKQYATSQEAASGGAEHSAEVIRVINNEGTTTSMGISDLATATDVIFNCNTGSNALIRAVTADSRFNINMTVRCISYKPIPGSGGALVFPPPPSFGGGGSMPSFYFLYSIISEAKDSSNNSIGRVEAVYRLAR